MNPITGIQSILKTIDKKTILAPLLYLAVIVLACMLGIGYLLTKGMDTTFGIIFLVFLAFVFIALIAVFLHVFNKSPQFLLSESYRLEEKKLDIIAEKGGKVHLKPVNFTLGETPKTLEKGGDNE